MMNRWVVVIFFSAASAASEVACAQFLVRDLITDLRVVEKESAEAKAVRLKWISEERNRIQEEMKKFEKELTELREIIPDPVRERVLPPALERSRAQEKIQFNAWAANNDPALRFAIIRGPSLNALLRVLGPIAHYRKLRTNNASAANVLKSLTPSYFIPVEEVAHYRLNPATSAGSKLIVRVNQLPLDLEWPTVVRQYWEEDCVAIAKLRDAYIALLISPGAGIKYIEHAELLDKALALLQAKIQQKKWQAPHDVSLAADKKIAIHRDLQDALRYLETLRATVERFKKVPSDYKVHRFAGGSIEEFLDFCYTHGMVFQEARPVDEEFYLKIYQRIKDYAHDVQFVEDWKSDVEQRLRELSSEDQKLVWHAAVQ